VTVQAITLKNELHPPYITQQSHEPAETTVKDWG